MHLPLFLSPPHEALRRGFFSSDVRRGDDALTPSPRLIALDGRTLPVTLFRRPPPAATPAPLVLAVPLSDMLLPEVARLKRAPVSSSADVRCELPDLERAAPPPELAFVAPVPALEVEALRAGPVLGPLRDPVRVEPVRGPVGLGGGAVVEEDEVLGRWDAVGRDAPTVLGRVGLVDLLVASTLDRVL